MRDAFVRRKERWNGVPLYIVLGLCSLTITFLTFLIPFALRYIRVKQSQPLIFPICRSEGFLPKLPLNPLFTLGSVGASISIPDRRLIATINNFYLLQFHRCSFLLPQVVVFKFDICFSNIF